MSVLLLDSSYEPLRVIGWQRAIYLIFSGKAEVVEESEKELHSATETWKMPSVIRQFGKFKRRGNVQFSRINIYMRDAWTCQYCNKKKATRELTFDHVVPRAHGGKTSWTNVVTCCRKCNSEKADQTLKKSGMKLMKEPVQPAWLPAQMVLKMKDVPEQWKTYIDDKSLAYWTMELESD